MALPVATFNPLEADQMGSFGSVLKKALANYKDLTEAQYQPREKEAELKAKLAKANLPFGGANVPGAAGHIIGLEMVKNLYGENSPQYQQAQAGYNLEQNSTGSRINYQNRLANSLPMRYLTPDGKLIVEQSNLEQGFSPAGTPVGQPVIPGQPSYIQPGGKGPKNPLAIRYDQARQKKSVPASVLQKNLYASNVEKTIKTVDPEALSQYSGATGTARKIANQLGKPFGLESSNYDDYEVSVRQAKLLSKQVRQFLGDSIQPEIKEDLEKLADPSAWNSNPKLVRKLFQKYKDILGQELQTYRDAEGGTDIYQGDSQQASTGNSNGDEGDNVVQDTKTVRGKTYYKVNGAWHEWAR